MKYFGNILVGNNTRLASVVRDNCRHHLNAHLREIAMGNRQPNQEAHWFVQDLKGRMVFEGSYIPCVGIRYSVFNYQKRT